MKSKRQIAVLIGICASCAILGFGRGRGREPQGKQAEAEVKIRAALTAQREAWNRTDVEAFMDGYWRSEELSFSGSSGVSRGWEGVRARYKKNYPNRAAMGTLEFSGLEIRTLGPDAALVLGKWHLKREKDEPGGVFTLVWQRFPEGWKIIHDHTSAVSTEKQNP
jgi:ketosteroid isomerase-like protein